MWHEPLPADIEYLAPVIERLDAIEPEMLDENNECAGDLVENALRERVRGLTPEEADRLLDEDADTLANWLEQPGLEDSSAHFINGFLLIAIGRDFLGDAPPLSLPAQARVEMEIPDGFELLDDRGYLHLESGKVQILIHLIDTNLVDPRTLMGGNLAALKSIVPQMSGIEDSDVSIGDVTGTKRLSVAQRYTYYKSVVYVLQVRGGWVQVDMHGEEDFDESFLEAKFPTLRVCPPLAM